MCCQIILYRLLVRRDLPVEHQLLEPALDPPHLRTRPDAPDRHDLLPGDEGCQPGRSLGADLVEAGPELIELLGVGVGRRPAVGPGQRPQAVPERAPLAGEAPPPAVRAPPPV